MQNLDASLLASVDIRTLFLWLSWEEMFDPLTPDSFQPRLTTTASLMLEIVGVAKELAESSRWEKHLFELQHELHYSVGTEMAFIEKIPRLDSLIERISKAKAPDIVALEPTIGEFQLRYRQAARNELVSIASELPKKKTDALNALGRWATIALQEGFPPDELRALCNTESLRKEPLGFVHHLVDTIDASISQFTVWLAIVGDRKDVHAILRPLNVISGADKRLIRPEANEFHRGIERIATETGENLSLVYCNEVGKSGRHAVDAAIKRVQGAVDLHNFYSAKNAFQLLPLSFIESASGMTETVNLDKRHLRQLRTRAQKLARKLTLKALNHISTERLQDRCLNALEHYAIGGTNSAVRVRFVNLWTSIECLVGSSVSVIDRVCNAVIPIVLWRRTDRIFSYLAQSLAQYAATKEVSVPLVAGNNKVSRERLMLQIAKGTSEPSNDELAKAVHPNPLLCYRLFQAATLFSNPKDISKTLSASRNKLRWHLFRIYRSRNLIVHHGKDVNCIESLADNLQYYTSITLSRVLHRMVDKKDVSVAQSLAYWEWRADYLLTLLDRKPDQIEISDFFASPQENLCNHKIWEKL